MITPKKTILSTALILASISVHAEEVFNGDDEYYEVYPEAQTAASVQTRNYLSVMRVGFNTSADGNLTTDDTSGISFMGEKYNSNNIGFLWRLNFGGGLQEENNIEEDSTVLDYSIGIGYGLALNKLNIVSGVTAIDNATFLFKGSLGADYQAITVYNTDTDVEVDVSLFATYMKLGAGVRVPIFDFWDVEVMLENTTVGDYTVEIDDIEVDDQEAEDSGLGVSFASNVYFNANKDFGLGIEYSHGVHDYTTISISRRF